jgi:hypothetical protein
MMIYLNDDIKPSAHQRRNLKQTPSLDKLLPVSDSNRSAGTTFVEGLFYAEVVSADSLRSGGPAGTTFA